MALKSQAKTQTNAAAATDAKFEEVDTQTLTDAGGSAAPVSEDTAAVIEGEVLSKGTEAADDVKVDAPVSEAEAAAATQAATQAESNTSADPAAGTALSAKQGGALNAFKSGTKYNGPAFDGMRDLIDPTSIDFNTFPRVRVRIDGFIDEEDDVLGKQIVFELMSFSDRYVVTTGVEGKEDLAKFSVDGITIDSTQQSVKDYIEYLKAEGFKDAESKKYMDVYGIVLGINATEKPEDMKFLGEDEQEIICFQVPPASIGKFNRLRINEGVRMARHGRTEEKLVMIATLKVVKGSKNTFAQFDFEGYVLPEASAAE